MAEAQNSRPNPDPTVLTTQAMLREIAMLKELMESRIAGIEKDRIALSAIVAQQPQLYTASLQRLQELHDEKFASIATQFRERDARTEQTSRDSKIAVDAALQAAKEAVSEQNKSNALAISKSEAGFTKQIDQFQLVIQNLAKALDDKINDIKERITAIESRSSGGSERNTLMISIVAAGAAVIAVLFTVLRPSPVPTIGPATVSAVPTVPAQISNGH